MDFKKQRENMVKRQLLSRGISDERLLDAFRKVERHLFVPPSMRSYAYYDEPLPIGKGQTISQPYIIALMIDLLDLQPDDIVLEVGTGSGYQTALLAELAKKVYSIERIPELAKGAEERLKNLGYKNIVIATGDGTQGWPNNIETGEHSPPQFDAIIVSAAAPRVLPKLLDQLAEGGRMVLPIGSQFSQDIWRIKKEKDKIKKENYGGCLFVPLVGKNGWEK
jgi:protein-L-isoaspartate(D-aspartate) O-methyltransferase